MVNGVGGQEQRLCIHPLASVATPAKDLFGSRIVVHGLFEFLDVFGRELGTIDRQRQFCQLAGERERSLIVAVIHSRQRVSTDVEVLVP